MPAQKRFKTQYPGVYYIEGKSLHGGKTDRIFNIRYRKDGKPLEEKAGRASQGMTPARASLLRAARMDGKKPSNKEKRKAEDDRWTVTRLWESYKANRQNLKGIITDENRFENHIKPVFGDKLPSEIDPLSIDRLRIKLLKERSPGTVKNIMELLRRICNYAHKKRLTPGLPFTLEMPTVNNLRTEDVNADQLRSLLEAMDTDINEQAANLMRMVLFTGMRRSELFKLKWADIDEQRGFIKLEDPKGGTDMSIPLNDAARDLLKSHPQTGSQYVFPGRDGGQRKDIHHQVNRIRDNAGLPKSFRALHGLRHVYASMLASSGKVDLYTLQRLLTHKSPQMTMRYAHLRDEALRDASQVAGDIVAQALTPKSEQPKVVSIER
jgi:integrase